MIIIFKPVCDRENWEFDEFITCDENISVVKLLLDEGEK